MEIRKIEPITNYWFEMKYKNPYIENTIKEKKPIKTFEEILKELQKG